MRVLTYDIRSVEFDHLLCRHGRTDLLGDHWAIINSIKLCSLNVHLCQIAWSIIKLIHIVLPIDPYCVTYPFTSNDYIYGYIFFRAPISICHIDGLVQERHNSIANALELRLSCTNPSIWYTVSSLLTFNLKAYHVCGIRKTSPTVRLRHIYLPAFLRLYSGHWRWVSAAVRATPFGCWHHQEHQPGLSGCTYLSVF